jgi:hypothetical protein
MLRSPSRDGVVMRKAKPDSFVRGVALRDIAALKRRVQALERAVWPDVATSSRRKTTKPRPAVVDEPGARRAAIEAFNQELLKECLRKHPEILAAQRAERTRLNKYLRERGFTPEPEIDE